MLVQIALYLVCTTSWFDCVVQSEDPICYQRTHNACVASGFDQNGVCTPDEYSSGGPDEFVLDIEFSTAPGSYIVDWVFMDWLECSKGGTCEFEEISVEPIVYGCSQYHLWDDFDELPAQYTNLNCTEHNLGFDPDELGY